MHKSVLIEGNNKLKKQKNMFLLTSSLLLVSNTFLAIAVFTVDQKVVMVPALRHEMMVSQSGVSKSYLEEISLLFLSNLLDLSPSDIVHKKELVLKYTSSSDKKALKQLLEYFVLCEKDYKRFNLSTYFSVKNLEIDLKNLSVIAHGVLTSYYGKAGHETSSEDYKLDFEYQGGSLRLKSFVRIIDDEKKARDKAKSLKFEEVTKEEAGRFDYNKSNLGEEDNAIGKGYTEQEVENLEEEGEPR